MLRWLVRLSPLAAAVPLALALPAAATEIALPCANGEGSRCEMAGPPPSMEVHPGEGSDTVTFENGHDARPEESMISSDTPGGTELEMRSEPPRSEGDVMGNGEMNGKGDTNGDGDMIGEGDHPIMGEPGDHLPVGDGFDAIGDPPGGGVPDAVPEPGELLMLAFAAGGLLLARRRA